MKTLVSFVFILASFSAMSQKFALEGLVIDKEATSLEGATVYVQSIKDSTTMAYAITDKKGEFSIRVNAESESKLLFKVAYLGYKTYSRDIKVPQEDRLHLGDITIEEQLEELTEVFLVGKAPPVLMKKDTVEYNADSFKTLPNDKVEDLLKKLPGIEIDLDGMITHNGVEVEAVNVDGMRFFGEKNGNIAIKNLPSVVIDKVQVTDFKTDLQKFTGEASDSGTKELNLKIKKGKNKGYFGDVAGGYGTDDKYQANANLFQLIEGKQLGVISGTNNINMSKGFNSLPDTDTSNGYLESSFVGSNFSKGKWNETRINGNYRYSTQNRETEQKTRRENFLPDLNYITNSKKNSSGDSDSHTANLDLKFLVEPKNKSANNSVQIANRTDFKMSNSDSFNQETTQSTETNGDLVSDYNARNQGVSDSYNFSNNFSVTPRLGGRRDYFHIGLSTNISKDQSSGKRYSENILYKKNTTKIQDQINESENLSSNISLNASWNKELFTDFRIIPRYWVQVGNSTNEKYVFDYNTEEGSYDGFNQRLSTENNYLTTTVRPALGFRYDYKEFRFEASGNYTSTFRKYEDEINVARNFKTDFEYLTYSGRIQYRDANGYKNINLHYDQNVDVPSIGQLQPVPDVNNQLHIRTGNPFLEPAVNHDLRFQYQNNLAFHNINITGDAAAGFVQDKIINTTITDEDLIKYTTYTNIQGDYSLRGNTAITKTYFSQHANMNFNLRLHGSFRNNLSIQNGVKFTAESSVIRPSISFRYAYDKKLDFNASYSYALNKTIYDTDIYDDNAYFVQNLQLNSSIYFFKDAFLTNKVSYRYNSRVGDAFDGDAVFWNAGLGVQLWEGKGTLTLVGYDILGKNNGYVRTISEDFIQDSQSTILEQYFMLTFSYKFGRFAGQNMNINSRPGSGMRRIRS
ncbi:outer membrane beta-barrel protein [Arenibacter nanhaiticus]|uniref:outer membrane beta-barrel protein n=1 Tax=Arenibacter nanhaiticus TaxID=558155 RepID=UPI001160B2C3|nr:outer membrane beta-barrel protein [Arenibacter nanhaiticus]